MFATLEALVATLDALVAEPEKKALTNPEQKQPVMRIVLQARLDAAKREAQQLDNQQPVYQK
jgi:hypothetical protein